MNNLREYMNPLKVSAWERRKFLRTSALGTLGWFMMDHAAAFQSGSIGPSKPNILLLLADDMGYSDIGCYGSEIRTPNLDTLGREGVRFTQAYNTARCCPSRASLLTGLYPHQAGVGYMVANYGTPSYQGYLRNDCVTIAEVLRSSGYFTWMAGKWHVGGNQAPDDPSTWHPGAPDQPTPIDRGFDRFFGTMGGAGSYFRPPILMDQDKFVTDPQPGFYYTQAIGDYACKMITESAEKKRPFFGYVAFTAPHWPLHALPEDIARYRDTYAGGWDELRQARFEKLKREKMISENWPISPRDPRSSAWESLDPERREWESRRMAVYAAMIDRLDQNVGRITDCLERTGQRDNTIIIFLSDNGGCEEPIKDDGSNVKRYNLPMTNGMRARLGNIPGLMPGPEETFQSYGVSWANASNVPFRQFKKWVHEGGISTPLIINYRGLSQSSGRVVHQACHTIDIMPTILDFVGAVPPRQYQGRPVIPLEGKSLLPAVTSQELRDDRTLFWEHMGNRAIRVGSMKLVADYKGPWELYDLKNDRTELVNLADTQPEVVADMTRKYEEWAKRVGVEDYDTLRKKFRSREE